jgi:hypothetical protein
MNRMKFGLMQFWNHANAFSMNITGCEVVPFLNTVTKFQPHTTASNFIPGSNQTPCTIKLQVYCGYVIGMHA